MSWPNISLETLRIIRHAIVRAEIYYHVGEWDCGNKADSKAGRHPHAEYGHREVIR